METWKKSSDTSVWFLVLHQGKTDELQTHSGPKNVFQGNHTRIKYLVIRISSIGFTVSGKYDTKVKWLSKCT